MRTFIFLFTVVMAASPAATFADEPLSLTISGHRFAPTELHVPAGKRVSIYVSNNDPTPEEFDSAALKIEKVIAGNSKGLIRVGPLDPGRYEFIGEYHADTAKGAVIAE
jgi:Cupredoxin-like domain